MNKKVGMYCDPDGVFGIHFGSCHNVGEAVYSAYAKATVALDLFGLDDSGLKEKAERYAETHGCWGSVIESEVIALWETTRDILQEKAGIDRDRVEYIIHAEHPSLSRIYVDGNEVYGWIQPEKKGEKNE